MRLHHKLKNEERDEERHRKQNKDGKKERKLSPQQHTQVSVRDGA
jgi:hypothetical protein